MKSSNRERHKAIMRIRVQNDALEAALSPSAQLLIEEFKAQRKEILMRSLLNLRDSFIEPFLLTVLNLSYWALLKRVFIVLTVVNERNTQFERWTEDNGQPQQREELHDLNLTT